MKTNNFLTQSSNNFIKEILFILLLIIASSSLFSCTKTENQEIAPENSEVISKNETEIATTQDSIKKITEEEATKTEREVPDWVNILPENKFGDIEKIGDNYSYNYQPEKTDNGNIARELSYTQKSDGKFLGSMKLSFSNTEGTYRETIPKSFAEHVDDIDFSITPSKIINPDPVVEFSDIKGELEITAKKAVSPEEVKKTMEKQLLDREFKRCEGLEQLDMQNCALQLVAKYRDSEALEEELTEANFDLTTVFGASIYAVKSEGFSKCSWVKDAEEKNLCYEYSYQVLVAECNSLTGINYRNCVRGLSLQLPDMGVRRLFCHHIDDEKMYNECLGKAEISSCDEIKNDDQRMLCQINIVKTEGDIELCNSVEDIAAQDICRAMMGMDKSNEKYCNMVKDEYYKAECLIKVALANDDGKMCEQITHESQKDMCLAHFMMKDKEVTQQMCEAYNDSFMKELCNLMLIIKENDVKKCETMTESYDKNFCYLVIAAKTKNKKLCQKITDQELKDICIKQLEEPEFPAVSCSNVPGPVCPLIKKSPLDPNPIIAGEDGRQTICSYRHLKENKNFPIYREEDKKGDKLDGMYKLYNESGGIFVARQYSEGKVNGYDMQCDAAGTMTSCRMYENGKKIGSCMPQ